MKRSNSHVYAGIGFMLAAIIVAGAIYFGIRVGSNVSAPVANQAETQTSVNAVDVASNANENEHVYGTGFGEARAPDDDAEDIALAPSDLIGSFAERATGPEGTCEGVMWVFHDNGLFQRLNENHDAAQTGRWQLRGGDLLTSALTMEAAAEDPDEMHLNGATMPISKTGDTIMIGEATYRSCTAP